ncbi:hypothetical protein SDC9_129028 [bioreactor metagenome]|uniref:Uncharacterized protein n=1 Tax=bioreactor metagenome TaxID=1076179 RepID=A0A645CXP9_9ZZZZ
MKWEEVRRLYPNQFVKFEIVESHIEDGKEFIDEIALLKAIPDGREAMKEFIQSNGKQLVYSTNKEQLIVELVKHVGIRKGV